MTIIDKSYDWHGNLSKRPYTNLLILHHAAISTCSADDIHRWHLQNGWAGIGYHYFVRKDGIVYRGRPEDTVGAHCTGVNDQSIGICFEGNFEVETMGSTQLASGCGLIADILTRYPTVKIAGHGEMMNTACPGRLFPLNLMKKVKDNIAKEDESLTKEKILELLGDKWISTYSELPEWAKPDIRKMLDAGIINGGTTDYPNDINMFLSDIKTVIVVNRLLNK